jgi:polyisoprenoid-binding protein YceI
MLAGSLCRKRVSIGWACAMAALIAAGPLRGNAADVYILDAIHSVPVFEFKHLGLSTQSGRFDRIQGEIVLDRRAKSGRVTFTVDTRSLNMGHGASTPDSPGFQLFRVGEFAQMQFQSEQLYFDDQQRVVAAAGQLTLLGVTRPLTVWVSRFGCSVNPTFKVEMCSGNVTATVRRSEFGMLAYLPGISDEINVIVPVEAYKLPPAAD